LTLVPENENKNEGKRNKVHIYLVYFI